MDSDDDGFLDGTEVRFGSNPRGAGSRPTTAELPEFTRVKKENVEYKLARPLEHADPVPRTSAVIFLP